GTIVDGAAVDEREGQRLRHECQRGVSTGPELIGRDPEQRGEDLPEFADPLEPAVVAGGGTAGGARIVAGHGSQPAGGEVELGGRGLGPGDVEVETAGGELLVVG